MQKYQVTFPSGRVVRVNADSTDEVRAIMQGEYALNERQRQALTVVRLDSFTADTIAPTMSAEEWQASRILDCTVPGCTLAMDHNERCNV